jgi:predicted ATP-dependent serine protease
MTTGTCARCGKPTAKPNGTYCRKCHGWSQMVRSLLATAGADAELLRRAEAASLADIARDEQVSRQAVQQRIVKARARQEQRQALGVTP